MIRKIWIVFIVITVAAGLFLFTGCPADVPPVGCGNIFGYDTDDDNNTLGSSFLWAVSISVTETQDINTLGIKFGTAGNNSGMGIYSDNGGEPGTLLAETGKHAISTGWHSASIPTISLTGGVTYWLAGISDLNDTLRTNSPSANGIKRLGLDYTATNSLPANPVGWADPGTDSDVKIYATLICP